MTTNRMEDGITLLKAWCSTLPKADILYFVPAAPWIEEHWKAKEMEWKPIYFNGSDETIESILRTIISFNLLRIYGAVADLCAELARDSSGAGKSAASDNLESMVIPTEFPTANPISQTDAEVQWKLLREYEQKFAEFLDQLLHPMLFFWRILTEDHSSSHLMKKDLTISKHHVESTPYTEVRKHSA